MTDPTNSQAEASTALDDYVARLRLWGENDPDPDYFTGDVLSCLLMDCGHASEALATLLARATAAEAERDEIAVKLSWSEVRTRIMHEHMDWWRTKGKTAEANLIALAKMYGEACGELANERAAHHRFVSAFGDADLWLVRLTAAEAVLRERDAEIERLREAMNGGVEAMQVELRPDTEATNRPNTLPILDEAAVTGAICSVHAEMMDDKLLSIVIEGASGHRIMLAAAAEWGQFSSVLRLRGEESGATLDPHRSATEEGGDDAGHA